MLVNHYHTQLIILRAYMRISSSFLLLPLLPLLPPSLLSSCHWSYFITSLLTLIARAATKPAFHVLPSRLVGNGGVASAPKRHLPQPLQADDKVSIFPLHPPPGYGQTDTHRDMCKHIKQRQPLIRSSDVCGLS